MRVLENSDYNFLHREISLQAVNSPREDFLEQHSEIPFFIEILSSRGLENEIILMLLVILVGEYLKIQASYFQMSSSAGIPAHN